MPENKQPFGSQVSTPSTAKVVEEAKITQIAVVEKSISDIVYNRVNTLTSSGRLNLPKDYSIGNAMSSAWLKLQKTKDRTGKPVLEACTKDSIANTLLDMAIMGLSMSKDQCYPIAYGAELTCFVSVWGKIAAIKRLKGCESEPVATIVYEGDEVEISTETGEIAIKSHKQTWENVCNGKIAGAYASVKFNGQQRWAVLPMREIIEAWSKSQADKQHSQFTGEFCKRTALNRLIKTIVKTSTDQDILGEVLDENEKRQFDFQDTGEVVENVKQEVKQATGSVKPPVETTKKEEPKGTVDDKEAEKFFEQGTLIPPDDDLPFKTN
jgi:recombination protein RecT